MISIDIMLRDRVSSTNRFSSSILKLVSHAKKNKFTKKSLFKGTEYENNVHEVFWQVVKYGISGTIGGTLQVAFLYIFVDLLHLWYIYGVTSAYFVALIVVFTLQKFWTFQDYSIDKFHHQSLRYMLIAFAALLLNILLMYLLVDIFNYWHIGAQIGVVFFVGALSFLLNKVFTFNNKTGIN